MLRGLFDDELGPLARDYVQGAISWAALENALADPDWTWWDVTTPGKESTDEVIARAMDTAAADLQAALGDPDSWTWGRLHTATFREPTLGSSGNGPMEWYFLQGRWRSTAPTGRSTPPTISCRAYPDPENQTSSR